MLSTRIPEDKEINLSKATSIEEGKRFSNEPAGYLFGRFGLPILILVLLLAVWYGQVVIVILTGLVLSAAGLASLWSRVSLWGVSCQRLLSEQRAFPGEHIELRLRVVNRKPLPLPWIQIDDEIPLGFAPDISLTPSYRPRFGYLSKAAALLWYTGVSWKQRLYCHQRGYYPLGPMVVTSGDIFGFYPRSIIQTGIDHVIVYPRIFPISHLGIPSLYPVGESTAEQRIFEDPSRVIGVRDYSPRDSRRRIHWKASARHQSLQVKVFEPTTTLKVALFLAIDSFQPGHGALHAEEDFELAISTAASVANHLIEQGSQVGLFVNTRLADSVQPVIIPPGSSSQQLIEILEALAKVTYQDSGPFDEFLESTPTLPWGTSLIFILSRPSPSLTAQLIGLKEKHKLLVLQVGGAAGKIEASLPWHHIQQPADFVRIGSGGTG